MHELGREEREKGPAVTPNASFKIRASQLSIVNLQVLLPKILPIAITGASLKLLNSVTAGKLTYRNASY